MSNNADSALLPCDGCGQIADSAHISRRLERLAWSTRYRPLHIQALLLSGFAPQHDSQFLYSPDFAFAGEAADILHSLQIVTEGKSPETVQTELQKLGILLTHVLECPLDPTVSASQAHALIEKQLPSTIARIRRSLKPKRLLLLSADLLPHVPQFHLTDLPCPILPSPSGVFLPSHSPSDADRNAFRNGLAPSNPHAV